MDNGFSWDNQEVPEDFFNDSPEDLERKTEADSVIAELEKEDIEEVKEKTNEELADELFSDETINNEDDIDEDVEDKENTTPKSKVEKPTIVTTANLLKEKGIIDFELEEGEELTDELADELIEDGFDTAVDNKLKDLFDGLPDVVRQMVKYSKDGGDPMRFISTMLQTQATGLTVNMDLSSEANQEAVVKAMLKEQDYDDEYIEIHIETLKDSNKLEAISKKQYKAWEDKQIKANEELVIKQEEKKIQDKENLRKEKTKLNSTLSSLSDVGGIKLSPKDKKELPSYMVDKSVPLKNGTAITALQKDVWEALGNETTALQLAKLLRSKKEDGSFDFTKLELNIKTKVVKEIKDNVQRNKNDNTPQRSVNGSSKKELADYFK